MKSPGELVADMKYQRQTVGLGYLYNLLAWLNWPRVTRWLMRRPWHVADELRGGKWVSIYAFPKPINPTMEELNAATARVAATLEKKLSAPKRTKVASIRLKPGQRLWQRKGGEIVEVPVRYGPHGGPPQADVDMTAPIVVAMNAKNADRKLKAKGL